LQLLGGSIILASVWIAGRSSPVEI